MRLITINKRVKDGTPSIHLKITEKDLSQLSKEGINFGLSTEKKLVIFFGVAKNENLLFAFASREQAIDFLKCIIEYEKYEIILDFAGRQVKKDIKIPIETKLELQKIRVVL